MQNLKMVCPILKELEGLAPKPVLENRAFIQRNNQFLAGQFGLEMETASSLPFFPVRTP